MFENYQVILRVQEIQAYVSKQSFLIESHTELIIAGILVYDNLMTITTYKHICMICNSISNDTTYAQILHASKYIIFSHAV